MSETTNVIKSRNPTRTTKGVPTRKQPTNFEWNDKSITAYTDLDLEVPENLCMSEKRFLSMVDVSKSPVQRSVISMVRLKAPDYLGQEKDKSIKIPERKEFIYYQQKWEGLDHRGIPLNPVGDHFEGKWVKQFTKPHWDDKTGEIDYYELDTSKPQTIYTIPYSKKAVDDIIAKSAHTDKDSIIFTIKFDSQDCPWGSMPPTRNQFPYEKFSSWSWDKIVEEHYKPTVESYTQWVNSKKARDGLSSNVQ